MARTPGGGRSPSTSPPPTPPAPTGQSRPSRERRTPRIPPRAAAIAILRWSVLLGGLVIIADLAAMAAFQRTVSPDDLSAIQTVDDLANYGLFAILGVVVVRDTRLFYAGAIAGLLASLLDGAVVAAARLMTPIAGVTAAVGDVFVTNLVIGVVFAGASGLMYVLVRRWSGGSRPR
jgi:hypothetical protein